jgi:hypothetical protein
MDGSGNSKPGCRKPNSDKIESDPEPPRELITQMCRCTEPHGKSLKGGNCAYGHENDCGNFPES